MAIAGEKWLVMVLIFVISMFLGLIPYFLLPKVKSWATVMTNTGYHLILTVLSCAGAGVLLSTAALHMLPENRENLAGIASVWENLEEHFPLAEVLMLSGLAMIYMIEEFAHFILAENPHDHHHDHGAGHSHGHSHHHHHHMIARHNSIVHGLPVAMPGGPRPSLLSTTGSVISTLTASQQQQQEGAIAIKITAPTEKSAPVDNNNKNDSNCQINCNNEKTEPYGHDELIVYDDPIHEAHSSSLGSKIRSLLAVLALSFHAIMEGIAIGIENSSNVWFMFGAISAHKFVISFCMGMELCASKAKLWTIITSVFIFAILSPVGIFIGSYLTEDEETTNGLAVNLIQGFATGTILYVVFFEILSRERERKVGSLKTFRLAGFIQFLSLAFGLVTMATLLILTGHEHSGHDDHDHDDHDHDEHDHEIRYLTRLAYTLVK